MAFDPNFGDALHAAESHIALQSISNIPAHDPHLALRATEKLKKQWACTLPGFLGISETVASTQTLINLGKD